MIGLQNELQALEQSQLRRRLRAVRSVSPVEAVVADRRVVLFSTNDYLGLSAHPQVLARTQELLAHSGSGPRAASLVCGYTELHEQLERALATWKGTEAALLFPTGYMANVGVMQALGGADTEVFSDERNHASLIDGCRLSRSIVRVYRHADVGHLEELLRASSARRRLVVTDALFSMDGDPAPLQRIVDLCERHDCGLIVDEAHSSMVFGATGRGLAEHYGVGDRVDVHVGTLSKSLGAMGGYVAASRELCDYVLNCARSYVFTTALPTTVVAAALAALETFHSAPEIRDALWQNVQVFASLLGAWRTDLVPSFLSPIVPVILGGAGLALEASERLLAAGFHVPAIRPPTVAPGTSRLRISLSAAHESGQLRQLVAALGDVLPATTSVA